MPKLKKAFYFMLGLSVVPFLLSIPYAYILQADNLKEFKAYWLIAYFIIYLIFPLLYKEDIQKHVPNRYAFYGIIYAVFFILGLCLFVCVLE